MATTSQWTYEQILDIIADTSCCLATKNAERITAENNGEDADCLFYDALRLMWNLDALARYVPPGTVIGLIVDASADLDLSPIVDFGQMGGTVVVTAGSNSVTIAVFAGNFTNIDEIIDAIILALQGGWTGVNSDPILTITAPTNLGFNPVGGTITIQLAPYYILLAEEDNQPNNELGFSTPVTSKPSYVDIAGNTDLLYVPNLDTASTSTVTRSFDGVTNGTIITITGGVEWAIIPDAIGLSTALYAVGNQFQLAFFFGIIDYRINCTISGAGYNPGTGALTFTVDTLTENGTPFSPFATPPGSRGWLMRFISPGYGTVNLYNVNSDPLSPSFGDMTLNDVILTPISDPKDTFYHAASNSVFILCCAVSQSSAVDGVIRINVAAPTVIAQVLNLAQLFGQSMYFYPPNNTFYINSQNSIISKTDTTFSAVANYSTLPYSSMIAFTYNPANGYIYYSPYVALAVPNIVYIIVPNVATGTPDTFGATLVTFTDSVSGVVGDGLYYEASNNLLFVLRTNNVFQSYQVNAPGTGVISTTPTNYTLPNGDVAGGNMSYQSGINKLFIVASGSQKVYIFDPATETFDVSYVNQPNFINIFSNTNDGTNFNYFGVGGGAAPQAISVIHLQESAIEIVGVFEGTVEEILSTAAMNCLESPDIIISNIKKSCSCCDHEPSTVADESVLLILQGRNNGEYVDANGTGIWIG